MIEQGLRFGVERSFYTGSFNLFMLRMSAEGRALAAPIVFSEPVRVMEHMSPTLALQEFEAQSLIDALWEAGLRPAASKQSAGMFEAQSRHLEDMRALVFDKAKVAKP